MKQIVCQLLIGAIVCLGLPPLSAGQATQPHPLAELIEQPYVALFEQASQTRISEPVLEQFREQLEEEKDQEKERLEQKKDFIEDQIDRAQEQLKALNKDTAETPQVAERRHGLHCQIQKLRKELQDTKLVLDQGLDNRYDNKFAKLKVLKEWPEKYAETQRRVQENRVHELQYGDFRDIGFRDGDGNFEDQEDDVKDGREAVQELNRQGLLPPEVEDEQVVGYIRTLAQRLARHSDLRVPLKVTVLKSNEINAFALPGGFLFINSALILKAEKESELAGVVAHEIAHAAARHSNRLMTRATIASIIYQAAQIAAVIFTGGVASIGVYYALQYGFYGLGLVLNLALLGVSRDYEKEADILGTQYLWHAGYDTKGFVSFFDKMAQEKGYVTGLSWFRTHPPFYDRMEKTYQWIVILPEQEDPIVNSPEFQAAKDRLQQVHKEMEKKDRDAPTLRRVYDCENEN